jgi:hypothetical protein
MSVSVRFYLFADDGLQRISQRLMQGLAHGNDAMPQYAGTKQKAADVIVEVENGKPVRIAKADGNFLTFDKKGQVHRDLVAAGWKPWRHSPFWNVDRTWRAQCPRPLLRRLTPLS